MTGTPISASISAPISPRRRAKAIIGTGLVATGAFGALAMLALLMILMVREGAATLLAPMHNWTANAATRLVGVAADFVLVVAIFMAAIVAFAFATSLPGILERARNHRDQRWRRGTQRLMRSRLILALRWIARLVGRIHPIIPGTTAALMWMWFPGAVPWVPLALLVLTAACRIVGRPVAHSGGAIAAIRPMLPTLYWFVGALVVLHVAVSVLNMDFLTGYPSRNPARAGILPGIIGTIFVGLASMFVALPIGIGAAIYLNEFAPANRTTTILRASISNLAGVPSIVFGILGLALFVRAFALGTSIAAAGMTLGLLTLPIVIVVSMEALKSVPNTMREAAMGLGATRWQAVRNHVLPYSLPGMLTGSILALSRTMGETAPLLLLGAAAYISVLPNDPLDSYTALPILAFNWASQHQPGFHAIAWAAVLVLILLVLVGNLTAIILRDRFQRRYQW